MVPWIKVSGGSSKAARGMHWAVLGVLFDACTVASRHLYLVATLLRPKSYFFLERQESLNSTCPTSVCPTRLYQQFGKATKDFHRKVIVQICWRVSIIHSEREISPRATLPLTLGRAALPQL
jgi:hypothetical protein